MLAKNVNTNQGGQIKELGKRQIFDLSYKQKFTHAELVRALLIFKLPEEVVAMLDLRTMQQCSSEFVDKLRRRNADLLWRGCILGSDAYAYFLIEFQSTSYLSMTFRMLEYSCLLLGQHTGERRLPTALPIVIYSGLKKWTAKTGCTRCMTCPTNGATTISRRCDIGC